MPPRGSRGARGGRGRGAARAGLQGDASNRTSTDDAVTRPTVPPSGNSDTVMQPTPTQNTSSQNTTLETPENQAAPETQSNQSSTATASGQSRTPSVAPSRAGGRFRPKNIRRDAAERARLEEERNRNLAVKIKEEEREQRAEDRRARRGRGRGDASQRGFIRRTVTASGPFSAIPLENVKGGGTGWDQGGASSSRAGFTPEFNKLRYQPRRQNENRINTDLLSNITGFEDGSPIDESSRFVRSTGSLPLGLIRTEHEEAEVKVKTTAELEAEERESSDDEELFVSRAAEDLREVRMDDDNEVWHAAPKSQVRVKAEPGTEPEGMDIDMSDIPEAVQPKEPPSPEVQKTLKPLTVEEVAAIKQKKRMEKAAKDPEALQAMYDLEAQLNILRFKPVKDADGHEHDEKDNQMYLFQLPPILPPLVMETDGTDGEADGTDPTTQENGGGAAASKVKVEEGTEKEKEYDPWATFPKESGLIGKMNVRKSGKVEFDWGGTPLKVGIGGETALINTAWMLEQNVDLQNPEKSTGYACGLGTIMNRFVVVPVWGEEEDWDPSLEDIEGLGQ
ncbi:RNA polymerase III RPC4-domain-containing protein [Hypomontagnella submonticulosa]|nr:RNA polymerase III RPC4-domain-containing protein [Hypomontagnella submonticulosa]